MYFQKGQERLDREALISLQETWGCTHDAQHQEVQALQHGGVPKSNKPASGKDVMNFVQLINAKTKKAVCSALKKANRNKKHCSHNDEGDSNSDSDY